MSARDDLHALVGTTALVLRRGLAVALLAEAIALLATGGLSVLLVLGLQGAPRSPVAGLIGLLCGLATIVLVWAGPALVVAGPLVAFSLALHGRPRLPVVLARAVSETPWIATIVMIGGTTATIVGTLGGVLLGSGFAPPFAAEKALAVLAGGIALLHAPYLLAAMTLLPAARLVSTQSGTRSPGPALVLATAATPVVPTLALMGPVALPLLGVPRSFLIIGTAVGLAGTALLTLAVSVAADAVGRGARAAEASP
jgi:hypothetical protein